jgi:flagellar M-ring protein FliF
MPNSLAPANPLNVSATPAPNEADQAAAGGTIQVPQMLAKYRRLMLFAAASLMLTGFIGLVLWSSEKPYQSIYAGMTEKDAAAVVSLLQKEHIPYRLEGGGVVTVPEDQVYQVRMNLAGKGMTPTDNIGFELFDQNNEFGLSDFTRKINLQRALQGELAKTIEVMPQINAARVHLVLPKESAFAERDRKATASVMLQLSGSRQLPKKSVIAIQNLVAASIPELDHSAVTVVDSAGDLLSSNEKEAPSSEGQTMQEYQARLETRMEARLTGMLEQIVGEGQAVVRVSAEINREFIEQNSTRYNPDEQVLRSQKAIDEKRTSTGAAIGVPGVASNTPGAKQQAGAAARPVSPEERANRSENTTNFEISSTIEHRIVPFGSINKLSVATIVGGHMKKDADGKQIFTPRTKEELSSLQQLIERAMGYDEDRGDSVDVQSMPLVNISSQVDSEALMASENRAFYLQAARYGIAAMALLLLAWFILKPLAKRIQENAAAQGAAANRARALNGPGNELSHEAYARLANMEQVRNSIMEEPERASKVLREWVDPA